MNHLPAQQHVFAVLIVDDEPEIVEMLREVLRDEGFVVHTATNGLQAFARALEIPFDLVLTDLMMPLLDGRGLVTRLRAHPQTSRIPVLLMSAAGNTQPGDTFNAIIAKPFDLDDLIAEVQRLLT